MDWNRVEGNWKAQHRSRGPLDDLVLKGGDRDRALPTIRLGSAFLFHVTNLWRRTLRRRSQKDWTTWERIKRLADDWLPRPRILHPWPERRFAVRHPRREPYARIGPVRICAGGAR